MSHAVRRRTRNPRNAFLNFPERHNEHIAGRRDVLSRREAWPSLHVAARKVRSSCCTRGEAHDAALPWHRAVPQRWSAFWHSLQIASLLSDETGVILSVYMYIYIYVYIYIYICICVYVCIYIYIYIYMCVCIIYIYIYIYILYFSYWESGFFQRATCKLCCAAA